MATVAVLGAGIMATALAVPLTDNGHEVRLIGTHLDDVIISSIQGSRIHPRLGLQVPEGTSAHYLVDAARALDGVDFVMSGVSSAGVRWAGREFASLLRPGMHVITLAKGVEAQDDGSLKLLPHALRDELPDQLRKGVTISAIAGPSIAGEVAVRRHTSVVFTGEDDAALAMWKELFETDHYHVWTNPDVIGVEICAATKNCYAFAAGFMQGVLDVLGESDARYVNFNYGAALFGQASIEMTQWVKLLGGNPQTVLGLPGIGDCFVTSMGGRNVRCGRLVGAGKTFSEASAEMPGVTLEGASAIGVIGAALEAMTERGVVSAEQFPLMRHLYAVVACDEPVDVQWKSFFGTTGSGGGAN